ncbi:MAG: M20/M25/M40 family metallo-hydrolase [Oscillospiraceae bacterium]|nr:M20/M25/M40 family metallo-hydrolase [Oscillospiraceae bacterium]
MYDKEKAAKNFSKMLQYRTVAGNKADFVGFRDALKEMYPNINKTCKLELIGEKGIMYTWKGQNEQNSEKTGNKSIVLMSHYDVVPADNEKWKYPPFSGAQAEGKIWGRGALDTKGTLCAIMESVEALISQGFTPKADIYLCFGGDEETAGNGAIQIARQLKIRNVRPYLVLDEGGAVIDGKVIGVNHPCAFVGIAEKGYMDVEFLTSGTGGHSSLTGAHNPIVTMSEVIKRLNSKVFKPRLSRPAKIMVDAASKHSGFKLGLLLRSYFIWGKLFRKFFIKILPEIDAFTRTVGAITQISGGSAENIIPEQVRAVGNFRIINGSSVAETLSVIKKALSGIDVKVNLISGLEPSVISDTSGYGWQTLTNAVSEIWQGSVIIPYLMMARSDSRSYGNISENIFRFTPVTLTRDKRVSIHGVNENISKEGFFRIIDFYICLIREN